MERDVQSAHSREPDRDYHRADDRPEDGRRREDLPTHHERKYDELDAQFGPRGEAMGGNPITPGPWCRSATGTPG